MRFCFAIFLLLFPAQAPDLLHQIAVSGRCVTLGEAPDRRVASGIRIVPGEPPLLSFRAYESKRHGRFSNSDLMLDDAGH